MKFTYLFILAAVALFSFGCTKETSDTSSNPNTVTETDSTVIAENQQTSQNSNSGSFINGEKTTQGTVRFVTENGQNYLEFDDSFQTGEGPDVFVLLHREGKPESYQEADYVNLGEIENFSGSQRYAIPNEVNPADFRSVVIWCRQFNATFGYAPLGT
ncbi:DM13 domain-containing protein [Oscillatoria salina]|uniref:DM13 domain-containing protein n=1 Tax=Oscillatoria salina TaxID=331517 RepID=UPI001CCF6264|nr:DM13 domain-containing protein [Oscillatoria salina]MBZ8182244.1 DM13 domain-containing protein [Oscillatoria salina IIICB1]